MEYIILALILYFFIGAAVCLLICVNPNDPGILGKMSNLLFKKLPTLFKYFYIDLVILYVHYLVKEYLIVWVELRHI